MDLLDFDQQRIGTGNYRVKNHICLSQNHQTQVPHTNIIQDSFNIETKVMETSDSMAWECKIFTHDFLGFRPTEDM